MKQIYYVIQALIHGRGANIIKVVSLGLGLTMSILLFSRVVYEHRVLILVLRIMINYTSCGIYGQ